MEHSPSWEANQCAASQHFLRISFNTKIHCHIHKWMPPVLSWASSIQSITTHPNYCRSILILSSHLRLGHPSDLFAPGSPPKHCIRSPFPIRATCLNYHILIYPISRKIMGDKYRTLSSSLCSFLHSPINSSLLGPKCGLHKRANFLDWMRVCRIAISFTCSHETSMRLNSKDRRWANLMYRTVVTWE